jgi:hypothetical protein
MTEDLRDELQRLATAHKRTLSDYVRLLLEEHVEAQKEQVEAAATPLGGDRAKRRT